MSFTETIDNFFETNNITPKKSTNRSWVFDCPFCGGKDKLYINKNNGATVCFRKKHENCPQNGTKPYKTLAEISGLSEIEIKQIINGKQIVIHNAWAEQMKNIISGKDLTIEDLTLMTSNDLPDYYTSLLLPESNEGLNYITSRGITTDMLKKYNIAYAPGLRRIIFPVIMNGKAYGWQGRAIDKNNQLKMYNMPGAWQGKTLMFYDNIINKDFAILAEGAVSALKFEKVGNFVASMGKNSITEAKLQLIKKAGIKKLYLALDRDALNLIPDIKNRVDNLRCGIKCYVIDVPKHRDDFGDCTYEECETAFKNATECNSFSLVMNFDKNIFFKRI